MMMSALGRKFGTGSGINSGVYGCVCSCVCVCVFGWNHDAGSYTFVLAASCCMSQVSCGVTFVCVTVNILGVYKQMIQGVVSVFVVLQR